MAEGDRATYYLNQRGIAIEAEIMKDVKGWVVSNPCVFARDVATDLEALLLFRDPSTFHFCPSPARPSTTTHDITHRRFEGPGICVGRCTVHYSLSYSCFTTGFTVQKRRPERAAEYNRSRYFGSLLPKVSGGKNLFLPFCFCFHSGGRVCKSSSPGSHISPLHSFPSHFYLSAAPQLDARSFFT
jgi:hypothetical protein